MKKYKVLIVDDNKNYRTTIKKFLVNYDVIEVSSGEETLELIKTQYFNCMLIDYILPGMKGDELVQKIKENGVDIPIIMITAYGDELLAVQMMKLNVSDYITKQRTDELPAMIEKIITENLDRKDRMNIILEKTDKANHDISVLSDQLKQDQKTSSSESE